MSDMQERRKLANDVCEGYVDPEFIVDVDEIRIMERGIDWHKATDLNKGVIAFVDYAFRTYLARLN